MSKMTTNISFAQHCFGNPDPSFKEAPKPRRGRKITFETGGNFYVFELTDFDFQTLTSRRHFIYRIYF